ncbi:MAG: hypothetical protein KAX11_06595 [Candidatus Aminicenantes bacterium]|nr:hypothetical protein [Candidatus Aminicenantes bacterium]
MNGQRPNMFMPALIGGGIAGVLSAIPIVNCLCCLWIIGGAMLASYLLTKDSAVILTAGDGAIVGALSGLFATFADAIVSIPFNAMSQEFLARFSEKISDYAEEIPEGWAEFLQKSSESSGPWILVGILITAVIFVSLGVLGGIIGISLFGKKKTVTGENIEPPQDTSNR